MKRIGLTLAMAMTIALGASATALAQQWTPPLKLTWYWQLTGTPKIEPVMASDIDGFDNGAAEVSALHSAGQHVICYIDAGTAENWRSDYAQFPQSVLGSTNGWPGEKWLDVRQLSVLEPIMTARFQMCRNAGYDAVEPDNIDGYENATGFTITSAQQATYNEWVATEVHSLGMAVFQKNDPDQAATLQPYYDGVIDEQCNEYTECDSFSSYLKAGKPVLNAEYSSSLYPGFCTADNQSGIMGALYSLDLDGSTYEPCWPAGTGVGTDTGTGSATGTGAAAGTGAGAATGTRAGSGTGSGAGAGTGTGAGAGTGTGTGPATGSGTGSGSGAGSDSGKSTKGKSASGKSTKGKSGRHGRSPEARAAVAEHTAQARQVATARAHAKASRERERRYDAR